MTKISIHQPVYLPWLGFFNKIALSDIFVFLDDVQYEKNGWQNRNKIRTSDGDMWLTVPVKTKFGMYLNQVQIDNTSNWISKHKKSIMQNYSKSNYFNSYWNEFESIYNKKFKNLIDLNLNLIQLLLSEFGISTKLLFSSDFHVEKQGSDRILEICKILGCNHYLSGEGGMNYLNIDDFNKQNIEIEFQHFSHPIYKQVYSNFVPAMAAIDLLFNEGEKSKNIVLNQ